MKTLHFRTNIDCPLHLHKAVCGLQCLHGKYCQLSVDMVSADHRLTVKTQELEHEDIIDALISEGVSCEILTLVA